MSQSTAGLTSPAALKRSHHSVGEQVAGPISGSKRRKILHSLRHRQLPVFDVTAAVHDEAFFQMLLIRSISIGLNTAGFAGAKPSALESFRAITEEYMVNFLANVKASMSACRRNEPVPQDFVRALVNLNIASVSLLPHLENTVPLAVSQPTFQPPQPDNSSTTPASIDKILGPELVQQHGPDENEEQKRWIPKHFPSIPSIHTWKSTATFADRESDPVRIRQLSSEEGVLAERALRKLMTAKKNWNSSGVKPVSEAATRGEPGRAGPSARQKLDKVWEETMRAVLEDEEGKRGRSADFDLNFGGDNPSAPSGADGADANSILKSESRILINYEKRYWRKGKNQHHLS